MRKIILFLSILFLWTCGGGGSSSPTEPTGPTVPTVQNITFTTPEDIPKTFTFTGSDPQNAALTYGISTQPEHGTVLVSGGAATYTPNANYHGTDIFYYIATSTSGNSNIGTIVATITPVDDEPNTMDATATTDEDNAIDISLSAEEYDGDNIQFIVRINPPNGSATISGNIATYTPNQDWYGTDSFTFEAVDVSSKSILNIATATITVNPINDAPIVNDVSAEVNLGASVDINLDGSDVEGDNLTYSVVDSPTNGSVAISGSVATYTPDSGPTADYTFTYKANDGTDDSNTATVTTAVDADSKIEIHPLSGVRNGTDKHVWLRDTDIPLKFDTIGVEKVNIYYYELGTPQNKLIKTLAINVPVSDGENEKIIRLNSSEVPGGTGRQNFFLITDSSNESFADTTGIFAPLEPRFGFIAADVPPWNGARWGDEVPIRVNSLMYILNYYYGEDKPLKVSLHRRGELLQEIANLDFAWPPDNNSENPSPATETASFVIPSDFGRGPHYDYEVLEQHTGKILKLSDGPLYGTGTPIPDYRYNESFIYDNNYNGWEYFTLSFWFKVDNNNSERTVYHNMGGDGKGNGTQLDIKFNANNRFIIDINQLDQITSDSFINDSWNFFALTVSDVEDSVKVRVNSSVTKIGNANPGFIRFYDGDPDDDDCAECSQHRQFMGQQGSQEIFFDNYAIWEQFMSDTELDNLFNNGRNNNLSSTDNLQVYFPMNESIKTADIWTDDTRNNGANHTLLIDVPYIEGKSINKTFLQIRGGSLDKISFEDGALKIHKDNSARFFANLKYLN